MWHYMFPVLIEVTRILEGASAHHVAWLLKFGFSHQDLLTEEEKKTKKIGSGF